MGRLLGCAPNLVALVTCLCAAVVFAKPEVKSNEIRLERMQIFVNLTDGPTLSLSIEPGGSVLDLMRELRDCEGIPTVCSHTRLMIGNREIIVDTQLNPEHKLSDYEIQDGTMISLSIVPAQYAEEIIVRSRDGQETRARPQYDESVASLKQKITQLTGLPLTELRLILKGKELKDDRKLIHYDIRHGTKLDLGAPLEDYRQIVPIIVKTLSGATIEVEVSMANTVNDLKEKIWEKSGVPTCVQHLSIDNHERVITGEDHLCDLGLEAGSTVYMYLHSTKITGLHKVARLRDPTVLSSVDNKAPIFHEVEDESEPVQSGNRRSYSLYKDVRNWVPRDGLSLRWNSELFDPVFHLMPNPDVESFINGTRHSLEAASDPGADDWYRREAQMNSARLKFSLAVRPYRVAANLTSVGRPKQYPGITLGGGSIDVSPKQPVPLGADVNNWAPDALADSDLMRLFEVAERVRQVLTRGPKTGEDTLSIARQRQMNYAIMSMYLDALAGYLPVVEHDQPKENELCSICQDELVVEKAIMLPCKHSFHVDCIVSAQTKLYLTRGAADCHYCRQRFMFPYEHYGKTELDAPDMQIDQDE